MDTFYPFDFKKIPSAWIFNMHCLIMVVLKSRIYDVTKKVFCQLL